MTTWRNLIVQKESQQRYGRLIKDVHNDQASGQPKYPATVEEAYALINKYSDKANQQATGATSNGAMPFNT
eukprot:6823430-Ditylum_brightwellii.AAC.1